MLIARCRLLGTTSLFGVGGKEIPQDVGRRNTRIGIEVRIERDIAHYRISGRPMRGVRKEQRK